ncbi:geraniol 8-hydroxylase-like [Canna indica]|uniref:Geraniol 8-hydroxylase-like n=1 Tax=Canna indica TaxID=4628 RepID=A0AAQ3JNE6_9LILI|nr:geraniol 8-hydroxylase-like [Canna indica]
MASAPHQNNDSANAAVVLSLLTIISSIILLLKLTRSKLPPGPLGLPLLGSLLSVDPELHHYFDSLARFYGPVLSLRLGSKLFVVLSSPAAVREALKDQDIVFANHEPPAAAAAAFPIFLRDLIFSPYGPLWRSLRKISMRELLSSVGIEAVRPLRRREVRRAVAGLRAREGKPVEVRDLAFTTAFAVMTSILWGVSPDDKEMSREFREVVDGIEQIMAVPNVSDFFPALAALDLQGLASRMKVLHERYDTLVEKFVEKRSRGGRSFFQQMREVLERGDEPESLTMDNVKALLLDLIGGGTDTTSTTIEWAMTHLMVKPHMLKRVVDELDAAVGRDKRAVEEDDLPNLPYLLAVIKETLRLHPVLPLLLPYCPSSTCTVGGFCIPKGSKVFVNVWAIHRDPLLWEDPLEFKPERFLNPNNKYDFKGTNFSYLPFGTGRRICVGILLAEKMMMYMMASFLHLFDWQVPEGHKLEFRERFGIALKKTEPLLLIPKARFDKVDHLYNSEGETT